MAQKITFLDQITQEGQNVDPEKQVLAEVIWVESYKKYNLDTQFNDEGCCRLF